MANPNLINRPSNRSTLFYTTLFCSSLATLHTQADDNGLSAIGDIRTGYYTLHRDKRDANDDVTDEFRLRLRAGAKWQLNQAWYSQARFAGRYNTIEANTHFTVDWNATSNTGMGQGYSTIDQLFVGYKSGKLNVKFGRLQTAFKLDGVAQKSLDRGNSNNTEITWTDGLYANYQFDNGWQGHAIIQYNDEDGASEVRRSPLTFEESDSRVSLFTSMTNKNKLGPINQRALDITYLPSALDDDKDTTTSADDYWAFVGRTSARWSINDKQDFQLGTEIGYAPDTPKETAVKTGTSGDSGGIGYQISFNWLNMFPDHNLAYIHGKAEAGWLLSPDFSSNVVLNEIRYQWKISKKQKLEARIRHREDDEKLTDALDKREDVDFYLRYTIKL
jgi:hypothetical protein